MQRRRKLVVLLCLVVMLPLALVTHSYAPSGSWWHRFVVLAGVALILLCILGRTWTSIYIAGSKRALIVDIGPYSLVRNPLYVFSIIGAAGVGLMTGSILFGLVVGLIALGVFHVVVRAEEVFLRDRFPEDFGAYEARVRRWLPRLSDWRTEEWVRTRPENIVTTFRDTSYFLLAVPAFQLIQYLQDAGILPVLLHLP